MSSLLREHARASWPPPGRRHGGRGQTYALHFAAGGVARRHPPPMPPPAPADGLTARQWPSHSGCNWAISAAFSLRMACHRSRSCCSPSQESADIPTTRGQSQRGVRRDRALAAQELTEALSWHTEPRGQGGLAYPQRLDELLQQPLSWRRWGALSRQVRSAGSGWTRSGRLRPALCPCLLRD